MTSPHYSQPAVMLSRARLHEALLVATVARGVTVSHCKRLVDYEQDEQGVTARFDDGSTARGSLLISADGIKSRVRELLLPDGPKPQFTGLVGTGGFAPRGALKRATPDRLMSAQRASAQIVAV